MSKLSDFMSGGTGGDVQIGTIVESFDNPNPDEYLPLDGSTYIASSYPELDAFISASEYEWAFREWNETVLSSTEHGLNPVPTRIIYGNGVYVASSGYYSTDLVTWTAVTSAPVNWDDSYFMGFANGLFVASVRDDTIYPILTSTDGITWTEVYYSTSGPLRDMAYGNNTYVVVSNNGQRFLWSADGGATFNYEVDGQNTATVVYRDYDKSFITFASSTAVSCQVWDSITQTFPYGLEGQTANVERETADIVFYNENTGMYVGYGHHNICYSRTLNVWQTADVSLSGSSVILPRPDKTFWCAHMNNLFSTGYEYEAHVSIDGIAWWHKKTFVARMNSSLWEQPFTYNYDTDELVYIADIDAEIGRISLDTTTIELPRIPNYYIKAKL